MAKNLTPLRLLDPPLGLYFRPGYSDHRALERTLAAGMPPFSGLVLDASRAKVHAELRAELRSRGLEVVLDPMALELATEGGWRRDGLRGLPWAGKERHYPAQFDGDAGRRLAAEIVEFAVEHKHTAIVAPTHFLEAGVLDPWWTRDRVLVGNLARALQSIDSQSRPRLYYRLAAPRRLLAESRHRDQIVRVLADSPIDGLWLCAHPVGAGSGPVAVRSYFEICADLHRLKVPLVAERTGGLGTAMLAFGVANGVETGITVGENFDANRLLKPPPPRDDEQVFSMGRRVYIERLGVFLTRKEANAFFARYGMKSRFGCRGRACCRDIDDMLRDPIRHFLVTRAEEIQELGKVPRHDRPGVYMERFLRRASDEAVKVAEQDPKKFGPVERHLRGWRLVFGALLEERSSRRADQKKAAVVALRRR